MSIADCKIINLPKIKSEKGTLTFIENQNHIPFDINRVYYLYDIPEGESRGSHAHKHLQQFFIAVSGSFDIILDDGAEKKRFHLNRSSHGLYVPAMIWRELDNFSSGSVCLVLASERYQENDYIRNHEEFEKTSPNNH